MRFNHFVDVLYTHTEGAPTCILHGGIPYPPGSSIFEKRRFVEENYDWLRRVLMHEPRGHRDMYGVFLTPPSSPEADAGMIWMDSEHFMNMCGHGTIGVAMAMVASGLVKATPPKTVIRLESTAGMVEAEVESSEMTVETCRFHNVPAFAGELDVPVDLGEFGTGYADIAFGGNFFGLVRWDSARGRINPENNHIFRRLGRDVKRQLNEKITVRHPLHDHISKIDVVTFHHEPERADATYRNVHIFADGQTGRSPGGTGVSAMMAMFEKRGQLSIGGTVMAEGPLGGVFEGQLLGEGEFNGVRVLESTVRGRANIYGSARWLIDPADPVGSGFLLT